MTLIRVDPASVQLYGVEAQRSFDAIHASLVAFVDQVVGVHYFGPNAVTFKTESGTLAADFANQLHLNMSAMADAVRTSTTNIAAALGGHPIVIRLDARTITPPTPQVVDYVDVDTAALEALLPIIAVRFESLREALRNNLTNLSNTDWIGNAKTRAVNEVSGFTTTACNNCDSSERSIASYVRSQLDSVVGADR